MPTDPDGKVTAFIEKPPRDEAPTNLINAGIYVLEPSVLGRIPRDVRVSIERETFPAMVADGTLYARGSEAYWLDTGTPDAYLRAHRDLLNGRRAWPPVPGAVRDPDLGTDVWTVGTVDVVPGSVTRSLLGRGASVAPTASVSGSVVGAGAVVENGATVTDSVLLPGARVAERASVDHSIVGPGAIIGQRCTVSGVSVVGAGAVIASGTSLDGERYPAGS